MDECVVYRRFQDEYEFQKMRDKLVELQVVANRPFERG